jgi:hypothetical protein
MQKPTLELCIFDNAPLKKSFFFTSNNTDVMGYRPHIGLFWTANDGINMTSFTKLFKATNCITTTSTAAQEIKTKNKQINT